MTTAIRRVALVDNPASGLLSSRRGTTVQAARAALERSLVAARERDDLLQRALTLLAIARIDRSAGRIPSPNDEADAAAVLDKLGVRHVAEVRLVATLRT